MHRSWHARVVQGQVYAVEPACLHPRPRAHTRRLPPIPPPPRPLHACAQVMQGQVNVVERTKGWYAPAPTQAQQQRAVQRAAANAAVAATNRAALRQQLLVAQQQGVRQAAEHHSQAQVRAVSFVSGRFIPTEHAAACAAAAAAGGAAPGRA